MNYFQQQPYYTQQQVGYNPFLYQQQMQQQYQQQQQTNVLNGKVVDGIDVVKATEVPIGGFGIFPKADMSEVYVKNWNNDGTTGICKYVPATTEDDVVEKSPEFEKKLDDICYKIEELTQTINSMFD